MTVEIYDKSLLGQYFTTNETLQTFIFEKVQYKGQCLLEPSFGAGHLLVKFKEYDENYPMICFEIDNTILPIININQHQTAIYGDFLIQKIPYKFKTIIANPPYIKQQGGNLYLKFIELCLEYCDDNGEMIFIVPSDFIKLTSAKSIISKMVKDGSFTDFLFPHDEKLFEGASVDIMIFRYQKGIHNKIANVNNEKFFCNITDGIITFSKTENNGVSLSYFFNVYVGLVSGKDEVYKVPFGNINILIDKDRRENFIFIDKIPCGNELIDNHLYQNKDKLLERRIKKFNEKNWFTWGAPRNKKHIENNWGKICIYVRNMTRKSEVAFIDNVQYFGGGLICLIPKENLSIEQISYVILYLNSETFRTSYTYSGRFKIGHRQLCNVMIPV